MSSPIVPKPLPTLADEDPRPLPPEVPVSIRERVAQILADPELDKHKLSYVLTPTVVRDGATGEWDLKARMAIMVQLNKGWSFSHYAEWEQKSGNVSLGVELRKVL